MFLLICSYSGPSVTPKISAIFIPGKIAERVRRKNSPASRSSTITPCGPDASQPAARTSPIASWKRSPLSEGSV